MKVFQELPLGELFDFRAGLSKPRSEFGSGYPFLSFKDVFYNVFIPDQLTELVNSTDSERKTCSIKRGDVFLTRTSETLEELGMSTVALKDYESATFNGFTKRLRPKPNAPIVPEYAGYFFRSDLFRRAITAMSSLSTRASLNNEMLGRLKMVLPSTEDQKTIGVILKAFDDKIELNRRMNETLEAMARALFKSWFVDFDPVRAKTEGRNPGLPKEIADLFPDRFVDSELGEIPEGWEVKKVGNVVQYLSRGISPKYTETNGITVLNQKCIRDGYIDISKSRRHDVSKRSINGRTLRFGDILINSTGVGTLGRVAQLLSSNVEMIVDSHVTIVRSDNKNVSWNYLGINLLLRKDEIEALGEGSTGQTELSRARLLDLQLIVPNLKVISVFDALTTPMRQTTASHNEESNILGVLRDSLLPKLIAGELKVGPI